MRSSTHMTIVLFTDKLIKEVPAKTGTPRTNVLEPPVVVQHDLNRTVNQLYITTRWHFRAALM